MSSHVLVEELREEALIGGDRNEMSSSRSSDVTRETGLRQGKSRFSAPRAILYRAIHYEERVRKDRRA
jgi:hypothetical protein